MSPSGHARCCAETACCGQTHSTTTCPPERIATHAAEPRDAARLMVIRRAEPDRFEHAHIRDLPALLAPGDRLVVNTTQVLPARFRGTREDTGGKVEGLYLQDAPQPDPAATHWLAMLKSRRHARGAPIRLLGPDGPSPYTLRMLEPQPDPPGRVDRRGPR
ncbi:MAG: S-adenosylmethionine:tRNA ribosyltransferase-isomerase [Planctomycetota bacterium]|nr:MAG: S-adenosylmethionine:tRNA ribosyltransferase-isomerase [Planctomycetota bacterium]